LAVAWTFASAAPALAHEERDVGRLHVEVGFGDEPPYSGLRNSVQIIITRASDGTAVADLADTLKVEVSTGATSKTLAVVPDFEVGGDGTPGDYRAWFIPTAPGTYTFHFTGTIDGQAFDQSFTSGPTTFENVNDPTLVEFPVRVPTSAEISGRLGREVPRLRAAIAAAEARSAKVAKNARNLAIVGIAVGLIGLLVGTGAAAGLVRGRRRARPSTPAADAPQAQG